MDEVFQIFGVCRVNYGGLESQASYWSRITVIDKRFFKSTFIMYLT